MPFPVTIRAHAFGRQCARMGFGWEDALTTLRASDVADKRDEDAFARGFGRALHFIGFRGDEYISAVRVWGKPDFFHRVWDVRARSEIAPFDIAVFAVGDGTREPSAFMFDDSATIYGNTR